MTHTPPPHRPRELEAALSSRPDGDALGAVWDAIPTAVNVSSDSLPVSDSEREAAWSRLRATLANPTRVPFADDVPAPIELVGERDENPAADRPVLRNDVRPAVRRLPRWLAAASLLAAPALGVAGWRAVPQVYEAPAVANGVMSATAPGIRLADGSTVWLAPGSRVRVPRALGWPGWLRAESRTVRLEGRGFFAVARDGRAFTVLTQDAAVRVLGTRFDVRAGAGEWGTQVTVEEGRVAVTPTGAQAAAGVELRAGQRATVERRVTVEGDMATSLVPQERIASWRTGGLAALDEPLAVVLDELARRAGVEITRDSRVNSAAAVSLFYPVMPGVDTVLADLCTAQGLRFERTSRGYHLTRSDARP